MTDPGTAADRDPGAGSGPSLDLDRESFVDLAAGERPVVVRTAATLPAGTAPLSAYAALTGRTTDADPPEYAFLLESGGKTPSSDPDGAFRPAREAADRHARYSFVGYDPAAAVTVGPEGPTVRTLDPRYEGLVDPTVPDAGDDGGEGGLPGATGDAGGPDTLDVLRAALPDARRENFGEGDRQHLDGGLVGFLAYDAVYDLYLEEVGVERPDSRFPDAEFVLTDRTVVFDHAEDAVELVFTPVVGPGEAAGAVYDALVEEADRARERLAGAGAPDPGGVVRASSEPDPQADYEAAVRRAKEHVLDGDIYQGVISRSRRLRGEVDSLGLYAALRSVNPSPYMYLLAHDGLDVVGASPETLVSVGGETVVSNPIAGTCPRGPSPVEDRRLAGEMLADGKERAEHTMLVDLARNDVRRVARPGSVRVEEFMSVLKYSHVQHIESTVTGRLAPDADAFDATRAAFPAGTLAGAPKVRAMEIIDDLEPDPRGVYGGGVGYYSWNGDAELAIVIRSATVESTGEDDLVTVRAGAGIVADSDPTAEYEETEKKMDGVLAAIERIERAAGEGDGATTADGDGATTADGDAGAEPGEVSR